jgi:D-beta-D-heptose 7-phosphate kinase / D-beta-D-heptose 1-phosphate adenosyltransferase
MVQKNNVVILVVGDAMLDQYWNGAVNRISPEAPIPIVRVDIQEERPGGAANVAMNVAALGGPVVLLAQRGKDEAGQRLHKALQDKGIQCCWSHSVSCTTRKLRVMSRHQQLIRLDFEATASVTEGAQDVDVLFHQQLHEANPDVVIFSDYAKGCLVSVRTLIQAVKQAGKRVIVDPKSSDLSRYHGADIITPNRKECEEALGEWSSVEELDQKVRQAMIRYEWFAMVVTLGADGMLLFERDKPVISIESDAREVFDVTGAGDTVIAVLGTYWGKGFSLEDSLRIANRAAGWVVGQVGATPIDRSILEKKEEKVVFTNGCFDIIHRGHLQYLRQAKALGTHLVVGVNTDASLRRLKGKMRPIHALDERMELLAALEMVDEVIAFDEDTPLSLIQRLRPDVLVKGGDYTIDSIVGAQEVQGWGGEVIVLPFVPGYSSTKIIHKVQEIAL